MFTGLYSGSDNFIFMSSNYSNSGTQISAPRSDAVMQIIPASDTVEYYVPVHFGQKVHLHDGVELKAGTTPNIDQIKEFNMSTQLSANTWTDSGIDGSDLATGTYVMQVLVSDYNLGGSHYSEFYSATISWYASGTNETTHAFDEIPIHRAGHAPNDGSVQFRTTRGSSASLKLQIKHNEAYNAAPNQTTGKEFKFKFRRLM